MSCTLKFTQSVCPVSVSIKLLRTYFNQQFYIMLYVCMYVLFVVSEYTV